ncbi:MAG: hypothetical protein ACK5O2_12745 [Microthrixaceae bacterium]
MGFLDKAKAMADQAMNSAESAMAGGANPKQADPMLRDLGVLAYLEATGRPAPDADAQRQRCIEGIQAIEGQTQLNLQMSSAPPPAPGTNTGAAPAAPAAAPPPPAAAPPPPPGAAQAPPPPAAPAAENPPAQNPPAANPPTAAAPPPPPPPPPPPSGS